MADFRALAKDLCVADGKIDAAEVKILKKALYQDGRIDSKEVEFLIDLRSAAQKKSKSGRLSSAFEDFFMKAVYEGVLGNGVISASETRLLRKAIVADGKVDDGEKKLIKKLKGAARKTAPQFEKLYAEVVGA